MKNQRKLKTNNVYASKVKVNNIYKRLMLDIGINTWIAVKKHYADCTGATNVEKQLCARIRNQCFYGTSYEAIKESLLFHGLFMIKDFAQFQ